MALGLAQPSLRRSDGFAHHHRTPNPPDALRAACHRRLRSPDPDGNDRRTGLVSQVGRAVEDPEHLIAGLPGALGEDDHHGAVGDDRLCCLHRLTVGLAPSDRDGAQRCVRPGEDRVQEQRFLAEGSKPTSRRAGDEDRIKVAAMHRRKDDRAGSVEVLGALDRHPKPRQQRQSEQASDRPVEDPAGAARLDLHRPIDGFCLAFAHQWLVSIPRISEGTGVRR